MIYNSINAIIMIHATMPKPKNPTNPSWGRSLEKIIDRRFDSQRKAAISLKVKQTTLSSWCHGVWPGEAEAKRIAGLLGVDYAKLVAGDSDRPDDAMMEVAIRVANDVIAETLGHVDPAVAAKLVNLAYCKLQDGGKPWDLPTYIKSLISLIGSAKRD